MRVWKLLAAFVFAGLFITPVFADACDEYVQMAGGKNRNNMLTTTHPRQCIELLPQGPVYPYSSNCYLVNDVEIIYIDADGIPDSFIARSIADICEDVLCDSGYYHISDNFSFQSQLTGSQVSTGISREFCQSCAMGTYKVGLDKVSYCDMCTNGQYNDQHAQASCFTCPPGYSGSANARDDVTDCYTNCPYEGIDEFGVFSLDGGQGFWE